MFRDTTAPPQSTRRRRTTAADLTKALEALPAGVAAWLLGVKPRTLRDWTDTPRNEDGTYNARELLAWAAGRIDRRELSDPDLEKLLRIADCITLGVASGVTARRILGHLYELRDAYGDRALLSLIDALLAGLAELAASHRPPTLDEVERDRQAVRRREQERRAEEELRVVAVCEVCERLRNGRRWTKTKPPADHAVTLALCPDCNGKS